MNLRMMVLVSCMLGAGGLHAQSLTSAAPQGRGIFDYSLEELASLEVTSASKQPEAVTEVPAAMEVLTRSQIESLGFTSLEDLLGQIPGFYQVDMYEDLQVGVRGILGGGIQVLVNGMPRHPVRIKGLTIPERERFNIPLASIDRIEFIYGPMSVVYGNNAFLGVINIITNDIESARYHFSFGYGMQHTAQGAFRLSHKFHEQGYVVLNGGLYRTRGIGGDLEDTMSAEQLAGLHPQMKRSLDGLLDRHQVGFDLYAVFKDVWASVRYSDMRYGFYALAPSFHKGNRLTLQTVHTALGVKKTFFERLTVKSHLLFSNEQYEINPFDILVPDFKGWQEQGAYRLEGEVVLSFAPHNTTMLFLGYQYHRIVNAANQAVLTQANWALNARSDPIVRNDVFAQVRQTLFKKLTLSAGVRLSTLLPYVLDYTTYNPNVPGSETPDPTSFGDTLWVVPRGAIIFTLNEHHLFKFMYGEATQNNLQHEFSEPERIRSFELNYQLRYQPISLQLSTFYLMTNNLLRKVQRLDPDTSTYQRFVDNSGQVRTIGVQTSAVVRPLKNLSIDASFTWQRSKDINNPDIAVAYSPPILAKLRGTYQLSLKQYGNVKVALSGSFVDKMHSNWEWTEQAGEVRRIGAQVDPYFLLGASLRYCYPLWRIFLQVHGSNLLNMDVRYPANELVQFEGGAFGRGLSIMVTVGSTW